MQFHHQTPFGYGYTPLVLRNAGTADMLMEFGVLRVQSDEHYEHYSETDERVWLLSQGKARICLGKEGWYEISRPNTFDYAPWCFSVPAKVKITISVSEGVAEFYYVATNNPRRFDIKIYPPEVCHSEFRGEGTMRETSTRIVRTIFDDTNHPKSNLVIGEVIGVPGKWSSYPPHHHPQPEIYHYRFLPEQGFGLTAIGNTPYIIRDKDTILIRDGEDHPQVTAPGYAMWYLWVIRHLENQRYGPQYVAEAHQWVSGPEDHIWQPKR
ncbi:MAG: 5-deoxy-glucuronate isomerase [Treponema sp.]|jgi:5-deoxy-glucuronate isomerase|nr:5-deoxy-glucuronate isomerase [Treponema sp.]